MAITIRKRNGLIIPNSRSSSPSNQQLIKTLLGSGQMEPEAQIIEKVIRGLIESAVGAKTKTAMRRVVFAPIYRVTKSREKEISKIYLEYTTKGLNHVLRCETIEVTGVTLVEFIDYMVINGAKEIKDPESALQVM